MLPGFGAYADRTFDRGQCSRIADPYHLVPQHCSSYRHLLPYAVRPLSAAYRSYVYSRHRPSAIIRSKRNCTTI